jgi:hypothetical protein
MAPNRLSRKRAMKLCADEESPVRQHAVLAPASQRPRRKKLDAICGKIPGRWLTTRNSQGTRCDTGPGALRRFKWRWVVSAKTVGERP